MSKTVHQDCEKPIDLDSELGPVNLEVVEDFVLPVQPRNFFDKIAIGFFSSVCFISFILLTLIICAATFFRYIVQGDLYGYEEWVKLLAFWLYFSGAAWGAYNGSHVSADLVQSYVPEGFLKRFLVFLRHLVTTAVTLLFIYYGYEFFMFGFLGPLGTGVAVPKTTIWRIPLWASYLAIFTGLVFMGYYFATDLVKSAMDLVRGKTRQQEVKA